MASLANAMQFSIQRYQFPSGNKLFGARTSSSGLIPCKIQSVSSSLGFSPESFSPVGIPGKALKFSGWDHLLRRRGAVDFQVTKAAAADAGDHEIESVEGSEFFVNLSYIYLELFDGQRRSLKLEMLLPEEVNCGCLVVILINVCDFAGFQRLIRAFLRNILLYLLDSFSLHGKLYD